PSIWTSPVSAARRRWWRTRSSTPAPLAPPPPSGSATWSGSPTWPRIRPASRRSYGAPGQAPHLLLQRVLDDRTHLRPVGGRDCRPGGAADDAQSARGHLRTLAGPQGGDERLRQIRGKLLLRPALQPLHAIAHGPGHLRRAGHLGRAGR